MMTRIRLRSHWSQIFVGGSTFRIYSVDVSVSQALREELRMQRHAQYCCAWLVPLGILNKKKGIDDLQVFIYNSNLSDLCNFSWVVCICIFVFDGFYTE